MREVPLSVTSYQECVQRPVFRSVNIPPDLLKIVNSDTWFSPEGPNASVLALTYTGVITFISLIGLFLYRIAVTDHVGNEIQSMRDRLSRVFHSTLVVRLCMLHMLLVIPLIFYVNTKEHYWTSKHTTLLFMACLGLGGWLAVRGSVPRFRMPYTWPIALITLGGCLSMFCAVNIAEGMGDLFAIFASAALTFLATQVFSTSKRLHLVGIIFATVGLCMSMYGLCQAYLLLPLDFVYALDTRAPVSTIGNKNYAAYFLDLSIPITVALAICRRNPLQTIFALIIYFICRWHFVLCDTRGGTISMTVGILLTTLVVAKYHGARFRLFLYLILLEPLLWSAVNAPDLHYADTQYWGRMLNLGGDRRAINVAAQKVWASAPEELRNALTAGHLTQWFMKGNEYLLGLQWRVPALLCGIILALGIFWLLVTRIKDWRIHLGGAAVLAFLPYWFVVWGTFPNNIANSHNVQMIVTGVEQADIPYKEIASQIIGQYAPDILRAAIPYNNTFLAKQVDVAAMFSFSLLMCMVVFLLFRWFDREEGWLPGLACISTISLWYLVYLMLGAEGRPIAHMFKLLFSPLSHAWPIELQHLTKHYSLLALVFSAFSFAMVSLISLGFAIISMQYIPAHFSEKETRDLASKGIQYGKIAAGVLVVLLLLGVWFHPRIVRVRQEIYRTSDEGIVRALFHGAHAYFNTQGQIKGEDMDGPIGFRLEIYQGTLRKMRDNPILGVGPGNFKVINPHPKYETALERRILGKEVLGRHPHNDFLEDATDSGSIALLGMIWLFGVCGLILFRCLRFIHPPSNGSDIFTNTITWGFVWAMTAIVIHAQFEMPLLQPSSTYPAWMLLGICYQLWRIQRRRALAVRLNSPLLLSTSNELLAERVLGDKKNELGSAAVYELPPVRPEASMPWSGMPGWISWPVVGIVVTLLMGSVLMRQFVGEMWLRWGMIFSEPGVERYDYVFKCMDKSEHIYPLEMETNYILGRYCIDATSKVFRAWQIKNRPDIFSEAERAENEKDIQEIRRQYQLDVDKIVDYAQLGIDVHKRDIFMNPNYKWAHNNMGVLYDKMTQIYDTLAVNAKDPAQKAEYLSEAREAEQSSRNCYSIALEIDDLQVYALYNLGHGALRDNNLALAVKYFERTLLADPNRGDVNFFIAKCRFGLHDLAGGLESLEKLFAWTDIRKSNKIDDYQKREAESLLQELARFSVTSGDPSIGYRASQILSKRYDRCTYLPLLAHAAVDSGSAEEALGLVNTTLSECGNKISSEVVFAQAKAYCLLKNATAAISSLDTLMRSGAGEIFRPEITRDKAFDLIREQPIYRNIMKAKVAPKPAPKPVPQPAQPPIAAPPQPPAPAEAKPEVKTETAAVQPQQASPAPSAPVHNSSPPK